MLTSHPVRDPLFLYLSIHMVHEPYQAPKEFQDIYADAPLCAQRKMLQAMVSVVDALVHNLTCKLNATTAMRSFPAGGSSEPGVRTLWDDTIFVFVRCPNAVSNHATVSIDPSDVAVGRRQITAGILLSAGMPL